MKDLKHIAPLLARWYENEKRSLPWRDTKDPYLVWLSEILLQQTRVQQGLPYFEKFSTIYPTLSSLANATETDVLRLWQGLGYYSRARNMLQTAKILNEDYKGIFPKTAHELKKLKGIGYYTAAAIASFCFNERIPVIDGNVFRVLSRLFNIDTPINTPKAKEIFTSIAKQVIKYAEDPGIHNQAIMEFGALHCTVHQPKCASCIFINTCVGYKNETVSVLPEKIKPLKKRIRYLDYLVVCSTDRLIALHQRTKQDIWQGMYEFILIYDGEKETDPIEIKKYIARFLKEENNQVRLLDRVKHILTHQTLHVRFFYTEIEGFAKFEEEEIEWVKIKQAENLPKPKVINDCLKKVANIHLR